MKTPRLPFVNYPEVGKRLRTILIEKKVSQSDLAKRAEVKGSNLSRFLASGIGLSAEKIQTIARELDVDVCSLYGVSAQ